MNSIYEFVELNNILISKCFLRACILKLGCELGLYIHFMAVTSRLPVKKFVLLLACAIRDESLCIGKLNTFEKEPIFERYTKKYFGASSCLLPKLLVSCSL